MSEKRKSEQLCKAFAQKATVGWKKFSGKASVSAVKLRAAFAKAAAPVRSQILPWSKRLAGAALVAAGTAGSVGAVFYLSHTERYSPSVVYTEPEGKIYVYPQEKRVFREMGDRYLMADFNRQYACEGVRLDWPSWMTAAENKSNYSVRECRTVTQLKNPGGVGTRELRPADVWKMKPYLDKSLSPPRG